MTFGLFLTAVLVHIAAAVSPGPSFVLSVRTAAAEGFRVAAALALGFGLGAATWAIAALVGLKILFEVVPSLFIALKLAGGLFLLYIAVQMWRHARDPVETHLDPNAAPRSMLSGLRLGFTTFMANPKPAVFFGSIFVTIVPQDTPVPWLIALVTVVGLNEMLWYLVVARAFSLIAASAR